MLAAMWKKEKWLNVERIIGEQRVPAGTNNGFYCVCGSETLSLTRRDSLEAGLQVKYFIMKRCRDGTLQQQNTIALAAMIPGKTRHLNETQSEMCAAEVSIIKKAKVHSFK